MPSPAPSPDDLSLPLLGHDVQTALAGIAGHAQLLQRYLRRQGLPPGDLDRHLTRLDGVIELALRASGLVALLQTGAWRSYGAGDEPDADLDQPTTVSRP